MSNQHTPQSNNSPIIYQPIPLRLSFSASRSSRQKTNSEVFRLSTSKQSYSIPHSPSPRRILLSKFEAENQERPHNPMTRDEKFKELQNLFSAFDSESFLQEVELLE